MQYIQNCTKFFALSVCVSCFFSHFLSLSAFAIYELETTVEAEEEGKNRPEDITSASKSSISSNNNNTAHGWDAIAMWGFVVYASFECFDFDFNFDVVPNSRPRWRRENMLRLMLRAPKHPANRLKHLILFHKTTTMTTIQWQSKCIYAAYAPVAIDRIKGSLIHGIEANWTEPNQAEHIKTKRIFWLVCYFCCSRSLSSTLLISRFSRNRVSFCREKKNCSCRNHFKCPPFVVCMHGKHRNTHEQRAKCASLTVVFRLDALAINVCCTATVYKCTIASFPCSLRCGLYRFAPSAAIVFQRLHFLWNFPIRPLSPGLVCK